MSLKEIQNMPCVFMPIFINFGALFNEKFAWLSSREAKFEVPFEATLGSEKKHDSQMTY